MNWRKPIYLAYASLRGYGFPSLLRKHRREYERGVSGSATTLALNRLLRHCRQEVPYYAELLEQGDGRGAASADPREVLRRLPVLTKAIIREEFGRLKSRDLEQRQWHSNTSGGSTGEAVEFIQDREYDDHRRANSLFFHSLLDCDVGDPLVRLWGSERDLDTGTRDYRARFFNWLTHTTWMNAFQMSTARMREFIQMLNRSRPRLIVAYAQAAYELARFAERERIAVTPQRTIVTSAGTLHPFMRQKIAEVFGCDVYNMYGSREVGDIACERPGLDGLWVAPWGHFVEVVDEAGRPLPPGTEGNIVVTCLTNYAMPLLRYAIGDRGTLTQEHGAPTGHPGTQVLQRVSGRNVDVFRTRDRTLVDGEYFTHLLYFRPWVWKFQVVQKAPAHVVFRVVSANGRPAQTELDDITSKTRRVLGDDCRVDFDFPGDLRPAPSGKYRYTISEVEA